MVAVDQSTSLENKYQKSDSIVSRIIAGQAVLVPVQKNVGNLDHIFTLNETGAAIWNSLDGQRSLKDLLGILLSEYETSESEASQDLLELIARLVEIGAVEKV